MANIVLNFKLDSGIRMNIPCNDYLKIIQKPLLKIKIKCVDSMTMTVLLKARIKSVH